MEGKDSLLVKQENYLEAGIHIGTKIRTNDMKPFIFKRRDDGLYILDLREADRRLRIAAKILSKYKPEEILIIASRAYSSSAAGKLGKLLGVPIIKGRYPPGAMTNVRLKHFREPKIVLICDPKGEKTALTEAAKNGIPIVALCDTDNETKFVDWIVPVNNKGRRSLALIFYILTRELSMAWGHIKSYDEFKQSPQYFEQLDIE